MLPRASGPTAKRCSSWTVMTARSTPTTWTTRPATRGKDITVAADNGSPRGIWGNHETIWVSDTGDDKVYAYRRVEDPNTAEAEYGTRDYARDFNTLSATGNTSARGIWSDGLDMFVADTTSGARKVYSYSTFDMAHRPARDFDLDDENDHAGRRLGRRWGRCGWWMFRTPSSTPTACRRRRRVSVTASPRRVAGGGLVTLTGMVTNPGSGTLTYAWSSSGDLGTFAGASAPNATWAAPDATGEDRTVTLTLTVTGEGGATRTATADVVVSAPITGDFDLHADNGHPRGVWGNDDTIWVSNSPLGTSDGDKIFAYDRSTRVRDEAKDFNTLNSAGNNSPAGIWSDGETMFVLDSDSTTRSTPTTWTTRPATTARTSPWRLTMGVPKASGATTETIWVSEDYAINGQQAVRVQARRRHGHPRQRVRNAGRGQRLQHAELRRQLRCPRGIWSDGTDMFVADSPVGRPSVKRQGLCLQHVRHVAPACQELQPG